MPVRFHKQLKVAPGVWINLGKTGLTLSVGLRDYGIPLTTNISRKAAHMTVSLAGTGLSYRQKVVDFRRKKASENLRSRDRRATGSGKTNNNEPPKEAFVMSIDTCAVCGCPLSPEVTVEDVSIDLGFLGTKVVKDVPTRSCTFPGCNNTAQQIQAFGGLLTAVGKHMTAKRFAMVDGIWKVV